MLIKRISAYYALTKPGIIRGNAITALAGFLLAANGRVDAGLLVAMLSGLCLIIASACVVNNYTDRGIDLKMARTNKRALATGDITARSAIAYALILGVSGIAILALFTNILALLLALFGFVAYVILYGIGKRRTLHGTLIGSISGAVPPVVGYTAVTGIIDAAAILLFFILVFWQMPHFYAIAIYRLQDYKTAGIPVLPAVKNIKTAKIHMGIYIVGFIALCLLLSLSGYTGYAFAITTVLIGGYWLWLSLAGFHTADDNVWARKMFGASLLVITLLCITISANPVLP